MYVYYVLNFISLYKFICILIIISLIYFLFVNKIWIMYIQFNNYQSKNSCIVKRVIKLPIIIYSIRFVFFLFFLIALLPP